MKKLGAVLMLLAVVLFVFCGIFAFRSADKVTNYVLNEDDVGQSVNAYVHGDGYNLMINGTYFTAYAVYASACGLGGLLALICGAFMILLHDKMDVIALQAARSALKAVNAPAEDAKK